MKQVSLIAVIAALACGLSTSTSAAEKKKMETAAATPAAPKKAREEKPAPEKAAPESTGETAKARAIPFRGEVVNLDAKAKTFSFVNKDGKQRVFSVTDKTKVTKDDAPAAFDAITAGAYVTGSYHKTDDGKMEVVSAKVGAKPAKAAKTEEKKPE